VNITWLMRMAKWARRPPSMLHVKIAAVAFLAAIVIVVVDKLGYWPDWAKLNPRGLRNWKP
jgi:hypothetical protein